MRGKAPTVPTAELASEYEAGATLREIARRHGVSFQTLAVQLKNAGIARRPKSSNKRKYSDRVCPVCGKTFRPADERQRWCSRACFQGQHYKTHCKYGHPLVEGNLRPRYGKTPPRCLICGRKQQAEYCRRKRAKL